MSPLRSPTAAEQQLTPLVQPAGEDAAARPEPSATFRRSILSRPSLKNLCRPRSSHSGPRRGSARGPALPVVSQGRKSSVLAVKAGGAPESPGSPAVRGSLKSAPAGKFSREGVAQDDVSPSIFMLQELRQSSSLPILAKGHAAEPGVEGSASAELASWMNATLSSLPKRRTGGLPPLKDLKVPDPVKPSPIVRVQKETPLEPQSASTTPVKKQERRTAVQSQGDVPSSAEVLERLKAGEEGFSWSQTSRMASTFKRYTVANKTIKVEDLRTIMQHLGYTMTDERTIKEIVLKVTPNPVMTYHEFISFAEKLTQHEHRRFKQIFVTLDVVGSGRLPVRQLRNFMLAIGFTPLRAMMREALDLVNPEGADSLAFNEMLQFLALYRHSEGFTNSELMDLKSLFAKAKADDSIEVPANRVTGILRGFYGPQSKGTAKRVGEEVAGNAELGEEEHTSVLGLKLPEMLLWARRAREAEIQGYREKFQVHDEDGSNSIDFSQLQGAIADLGYTLTNSTIQEAVEEAEDEYSGKSERYLDFDEFVNIMLTVRSRDGFSKSELQELEDAFERFQANGCQEVETQSLCEILRYMGHNAWVDEVQELLPAADIESSGAIDFRHFQWFMRLHREKELREVRHIFQSYEEKSSQSMPIHSSRMALANLDYPLECQPQDLEKMLQQDLSQSEQKKMVTYDVFVDMVDACRAFRVAQQRRCAGFSEGELNHFRALFCRFDAGDKDSLSLLETSALLEELGFKMKTPFDRERFLTSVEKARENALKVGVEDVGEAHSPLEYWTLVQLIRVLASSDKSVMDREAKAIAQTQFGQSEVDGFKEVFTCCCMVQAAKEEDPGALAGDRGAAAKDLSKEAVRGLLRSLGITLDPESRQRLDNKIDVLNRLGRVDFADFLKLMRWMLDTNFADIERSAAQVVTKHAEDKERLSGS